MLVPSIEPVGKRDCARVSSLNQINFLQQLPRQRKAAGLSQQELADLLGVEIEWVKEIERIDSNPTLSDLRHYLTQCKAVLHMQTIGMQ